MKFSKNILMSILMICLLSFVVLGESRMNDVWVKGWFNVTNDTIVFENLPGSGTDLRIYANGSMYKTIYNVTDEYAFKVVNFTDLYNARTGRWGISNYTALEDNAFRNENFTDRYNARTDRWGLENYTAENISVTAYIDLLNATQQAWIEAQNYITIAVSTLTNYFTKTEIYNFFQTNITSANESQNAWINAQNLLIRTSITENITDVRADAWKQSNYTAQNLSVTASIILKQSLDAIFKNNNWTVLYLTEADTRWGSENFTAENPLIDSDFASAGLMKTDGAGAYSIVTDSSSNWDTAYTERGSQIGGTGLTWDSTELNVDDDYLKYTGGKMTGDINMTTSNRWTCGVKYNLMNDSPTYESWDCVNCSNKVRMHVNNNSDQVCE